MNTTPLATAVRDLLATLDRAADTGPLWCSEAEALAAVLNARRVRGAIGARPDIDAEGLAEEIDAIAARWPHARLTKAAAAAVFLAEGRHVTTWLWFTRADLAREVADALTTALIAHGWNPADR